MAAFRRLRLRTRISVGVVEFYGCRTPARSIDGVCNHSDGFGYSRSRRAAWPKLGRGNEVDVTGEAPAPNGKLWYRIRIAGVHTGWVYGGYLNHR